MKIDSAFNRWRDAGGSLATPYFRRKNRVSLYPYMRGDGRGYGIRWGVVAYIGVALAVVGYFVNVVASPVEQTTPQIAGEQIATSQPVLPEIDQAFVPAPEKLPVLPSMNDLAEPALVVAARSLPALPDSEGKTEIQTPGRVGWWFPALGGTHCPGYLSDCVTLPLSDGLPAAPLAAACPYEYPLGSILVIPDVGEFPCRHRLDVANCDSGVCYFALLHNGEYVPWSTLFNVTVITWGQG